MEKHNKFIEKAFKLAYTKKYKEYAKLIVDYMKYKTEADNKRARKFIEQNIQVELRNKGRISKRTIEFSLSGLIDMKQQNNGKFNL